MKRFMTVAATAAMIVGGASLAMAQSGGSGGSGGSSGGSGSTGSGSSGNDGSPGSDIGQGTPRTMQNSARIEDMLQSKGYNNISSVQNANNGRVTARAMKDGKQVMLEIDPSTGNVIETK